MARLLSQIAKLQQMVDKIITEEELIEEFKEKGRPLLAVDMTPREDFLHTNDLFRFHPLNLPRLSKFFQVVFLFKDLQGLVFTDPDTAKVISYKLYRLFKKLSPIDAKMILESEIIEEQIRDTPISFISSLYKTVLSTPRGKIKTTPYDALSMAVLFNETYHADIDAILLMNIEEENYLIVKKIFNKKNLPVPVALIRSFPDYAGIPHTHLDLRRKLKFPRVGDTYRDIIRSLKKFNTSISTIRRWYDEFIFHIKNTTSINRETFSSGIDIQRALAEGSLKLEDVYKSVAKDIIKVFSKYKHELDTAISEPVIFDFINITPPGPQNEVWLTDTINVMIRKGHKIIAVKYNSWRLHLVTPQDILKAEEFLKNWPLNR